MTQNRNYIITKIHKSRLKFARDTYPVVTLTINAFTYTTSIIAWNASDSYS